MLAEISELRQAAVSGDHAVLLLAENALVHALFLRLAGQVGGKESWVVQNDHRVAEKLVIVVLLDAEAADVEKDAVFVAHEGGHVPHDIELGPRKARGPQKTQQARCCVR